MPRAALLLPALLLAAAHAEEPPLRIGVVVGAKTGSVHVDKKKGTVNGRRYRGELKVIPAGKNRVTVVNVVDVEDYLRGVVPGEMSRSWPAEALKSQAVVARSYALANRGRYGSAGYDLCATAACQVYGGVAAESPATDKAVADTRGRALFYKGKIISAVFHSCCGGQTDGAQDVWRSKGETYLRGARCRWCRSASPHYQWEAEISDQDLARRMKAGGHDVGEVESIRILSRTDAGRAYQVRVTGGKSSAELQANAFRLTVGGRLLRSTFWSGVSHDGGKWRFHGRGYGHGVGLCQWCAKAAADEGYKHKEILAYFYRHAKVKEL